MYLYKRPAVLTVLIAVLLTNLLNINQWKLVFYIVIILSLVMNI